MPKWQNQIERSLLCVFFQERKVREIADSLNLSEKQVENKLFRSKRVLRKKLEERGIRNGQR